MAVKIHQSKPIIKRIVVSVMALALLAQPVYGFVAEQVASAVASEGNVVINEIAPVAGEGEKWVELYNPTSVEKDISSWRIVRGSATVSPVFEDNTKISPGGFYVWSTTNSFSPNGASVQLLDGPSGNVIDYTNYPTLEAGKSWSRISDGAGDWSVNHQPSRGASNATSIVMNELYPGSSDVFTNFNEATSTGGFAVKFTISNDYVTTRDISFEVDPDDDSLSSATYAGEVRAGAGDGFRMGGPEVEDATVEKIMSDTGMQLGDAFKLTATVADVDGKIYSISSNGVTLGESGDTVPTGPVYREGADGTPEEHFDTIQQAVSADTTENGDVIKVGEGVYDGDVVIKKSVTISGIGSVVVNGEIRVEAGASDVAILNLEVKNPADSEKRAIKIPSAISLNSLTLDGLKLDSYKAIYAADSKAGSKSTIGNLTLINSSVTSNYPLYIDHVVGSIDVRNSTFNTVNGNRGIVFNHQTNPSVDISGNTFNIGEGVDESSMIFVKYEPVNAELLGQIKDNNQFTGALVKLTDDNVAIVVAKDVIAPTANLTVTGGKVIDGKRFVRPGDTIKYTVEANDDESGLLRASNIVFRLKENGVSQNGVVCGSWHNGKFPEGSKVRTGSYTMTGCNKGVAPADGLYGLAFRVYDNADNNSRIPNSVYVVDGTKPVVSNFSAPERVSKSLDVSFEASDASSGIDFTRAYLAEAIDGVCKNNYSALEGYLKVIERNETGLYGATIDTSGLNGEYCVLVSARDRVTNNSTPQFKKVVIDNKAPSISNISITPTHHGNIGGTVTVYFELDDATGVDTERSKVMFQDGPNTSRHPGESYKVSPVHIEGNKYKAVFDTAKFVSNATAARYTLGFNPYDQLGNQSSAKPEGFHSILIDNSGPSAKLVFPLADSHLNQSTTFVFDITDETEVVGGYAKLVKIGDDKVSQSPTLTKNSEGKWEATFDIAALPEGEYKLDVRPKDIFGQGRYRSDVARFTVDKTAPVIKINGVDPKSSYKLNEKLSVNVVDNNLDFTEVHRIDSGAPSNDNYWKYEGARFDLERLKDGTYNIKAYDKSGNPTEHTFVTDETKPRVVGSEESYYNPASFTVTASDDFSPGSGQGSGINRVTGNIYRQEVDGYKLHKDNSSVDANPFQVKLNNLSDGKYYVRYNASDKVGNISNTEQFYFIVDKAKPVVTITSTPDGVVDEVDSYKVSQYVQVHVEDANLGTTKVYKADGIDTEVQSHTGSDFTLAKGLPEGEYYLVHIDQAANKSDPLEFVINRTAPKIENVTVSSVYSGAASTDQNLNFEVSTNDGSDIKNVRIAINEYDATKDKNRGKQVYNDNNYPANLDGTYTVDLKSIINSKNLQNGQKYIILAQAGNVAGVHDTHYFEFTVDNTAIDTSEEDSEEDDGDQGNPDDTVDGGDENKPEDDEPTDEGGNSSNGNTGGDAATGSGNSGTGGGGSSESQSGTLTNPNTSFMQGLAGFPPVAAPVFTSSSIALNTSQEADSDEEVDVSSEPIAAVAAATDDRTQKSTSGDDENGEVLSASDVKSGWSLVNLILVVIVVLMSLAALPGLVLNKENRRIAVRLLTLVPAIAGLSVLCLIEDFSSSMKIVNVWTVLMMLLAVLQGAIVLQINKNSTTE